jgi:hypothetical protein
LSAGVPKHRHRVALVSNVICGCDRLAILRVRNELASKEAHSEKLPAPTAATDFDYLICAVVIAVELHAAHKMVDTILQIYDDAAPHPVGVSGEQVGLEGLVAGQNLVARVDAYSGVVVVGRRHTLQSR